MVGNRVSKQSPYTPSRQKINPYARHALKKKAGEPVESESLGSPTRSSVHKLFGANSPAACIFKTPVKTDSRVKVAHSSLTPSRIESVKKSPAALGFISNDRGSVRSNLFGNCGSKFSSKGSEFSLTGNVVVNSSTLATTPATANDDDWNEYDDVVPADSPFVPYYLRNFLYVLQAVLGGTAHAHLFSSDDRLVFEHFTEAMSSEAQKLYVRVFQRKNGWIRIDKLSYKDIDTPIPTVCEELCSLQFFSHSEQGLGDLERALDLLTVPELKAVLKKRDIRHRKATSGLPVRARCVDALLHHARSTRSLFHVADQTGTVLQWVKDACSGGCVRLNASHKDVIDRVFTLFFVHNNGPLEPNPLTALLLTDKSNLMYHYSAKGVNSPQSKLADTEGTKQIANTSHDPLYGIKLTPPTLHPSVSVADPGVENTNGGAPGGSIGLDTSGGGLQGTGGSNLRGMEEWRIFPMRDAFIEYHNALIAERDVNDLVEHQKHNEALRIVRRTAKNLGISTPANRTASTLSASSSAPNTSQNVLKTSQNVLKSSQNAPNPSQETWTSEYDDLVAQGVSYRRIYTAQWVYARILAVGVEVMEMKKLYEESVLLLSWLLGHERYDGVFCANERKKTRLGAGSRGRWWNRLTLNLLQHIKEPAASLRACLAGLQDPFLRTGHRHAVEKRLLRLLKSKVHQDDISDAILEGIRPHHKRSAPRVDVSPRSQVRRQVRSQIFTQPHTPVRLQAQPRAQSVIYTPGGGEMRSLCLTSKDVEGQQSRPQSQRSAASEPLCRRSVRKGDQTEGKRRSQTQDSSDDDIVHTRYTPGRTHARSGGRVRGDASVNKDRRGRSVGGGEESTVRAVKYIDIDCDSVNPETFDTSATNARLETNNAERASATVCIDIDSDLSDGAFAYAPTGLGGAPSRASGTGRLSTNIQTAKLSTNLHIDDDIILLGSTVGVPAKARGPRRATRNRLSLAKSRQHNNNYWKPKHHTASHQRLNDSSALSGITEAGSSQDVATAPVTDLATTNGLCNTPPRRLPLLDGDTGQLYPNGAGYNLLSRSTLRESRDVAHLNCLSCGGDADNECIDGLQVSPKPEGEVQSETLSPPHTGATAYTVTARSGSEDTLGVMVVAGSPNCGTVTKEELVAEPLPGNRESADSDTSGQNDSMDLPTATGIKDEPVITTHDEFKDSPKRACKKEEPNNNPHTKTNDEPIKRTHNEVKNESVASTHDKHDQREDALMLNTHGELKVCPIATYNKEEPMAGMTRTALSPPDAVTGVDAKLVRATAADKNASSTTPPRPVTDDTPLTVSCESSSCEDSSMGTTTVPTSPQATRASHGSGAVLSDPTIPAPIHTDAVVCTRQTSPPTGAARATTVEVKRSPSGLAMALLQQPPSVSHMNTPSHTKVLAQHESAAAAQLPPSQILLHTLPTLPDETLTDGEAVALYKAMLVTSLRREPLCPPPVVFVDGRKYSEEITGRKSVYINHSVDADGGASSTRFYSVEDYALEVLTASVEQHNDIFNRASDTHNGSAKHSRSPFKPKPGTYVRKRFRHSPERPVNETVCMLCAMLWWGRYSTWAR
ncbi:hypothetical protein, variant [Sphaeroforma arctica JP610]|uniref:Fanconi-associated nuclease n=1 Tax=Sphaeroforma arctica JP610 TaxID=667725 RepID=A0A0L0G5I0_9EUKA|nr:hypothetical protein, variant [Sphaeroforma arctica JP610]KNC84194.1 hypothetical protein, variant [Sphaeroforma arctica JP610]|eukprot:XP_014158096.1 hypothetical protein, variant [Sphaeroforma arctica JP610]